jgi:hypothetical protein
LLLYRLDDNLPDLDGRHQYAMENGGAGCLVQGTFGGHTDDPLGLVQIGVYAAGAEDRDADAPGAGIERQRFREADNGELRCDIGSTLAGEGYQPGDRRGVDDVAAAAPSIYGKRAYAAPRRGG